MVLVAVFCSIDFQIDAHYSNAHYLNTHHSNITGDKKNEL